jgi:hypothetical protein
MIGMPRDGARTFGDLIGKLDHLEIVCAKCDRHGRYAVRRLIERYGGGMKIPDWKAEITGDCPRRQSPGLADACAAQCPGLLKLAIADASEGPSEHGRRRGAR